MEQEQRMAVASIATAVIALTLLGFGIPVWLHLALSATKPLLLLGASAVIGTGAILAAVAYALLTR